MCVIIITNPSNPITKDELWDAWLLNSDGAGFAYVNHGLIKFKKGFTDFETYWNAIKDLQTKFDLLLHLRITSRGNTNKVSTHPFKVGDLLKTEGFSRSPVVAMNGTISSQSLDKKKGVLLNDTASYIKDHAKAFKLLNQDIINIIADATDCRWASATKKGIIYDHGFIKHNGRAYSNLNHIYYANFFNDPYDYEGAYTYDYEYNDNTYDYDYDYDYGLKNKLQAKHFLSKSLLKQVKKDYDLWDKTEEYVYQHCNFQDCKYCVSCISEAETVAELKKCLEDNEDIDFYIFKDIQAE